MPEANLNSQSMVVINKSDLVPNSGAAVLLGDRQIAVFSVPAVEPGFFAIDHYDPIGEANVLARGIVGDIDGVPVVASPLYKQHFSLVDGKCFEDSEVSVQAYPLQIEEQTVTLQL